MFFLVGVATGGIISGYLSDRFGRRTMLFWSVIFQTIFGKFVVTSPHPEGPRTHADLLIYFLFRLRKRIFAVRSMVVWCTFGVTWTTWLGVGVRYIRWSHIGHWICRWKMANHCRHVQFISVARFVHDDFRHCISHTRFSNIAIVHRNSRHFPLFLMVSELAWNRISSIDYAHRDCWHFPLFFWFMIRFVIPESPRWLLWCVMFLNFVDRIRSKHLYLNKVVNL